MKKIIILGRGGAGKSTVAKLLSKITGIPNIELDKYFWKPGLIATPVEEWKKIQQKLTASESWIMDGDLGKYDALETRMKAADTVIILNYPLHICLYRAIRRSKERYDFWWWLITWRLSSWPKLRKTIKYYAKKADVKIFNTPDELEEFVKSIKKKQSA